MTPAATAKPIDETLAERAQAVKDHRARQMSVAGILECTFGTLADQEPGLWDDRAYLMLVGMVYERLAIHEDQLPTSELVALAKILAESRRAQNQKHDTLSDPDTPVVTQVATAARELYGVEDRSVGALAGTAESDNSNSFC